MEKELDETYPEIVYKYRNWNNDFNKAFLTRNELFLTSPLYFNDPFDCRIPTNYFLLDTPEKKEEFILMSFSKHARELRKRGIDIESSSNYLRERLQDLEKFQGENNESLFQLQNDHYGVVSLTERWDSILMWSHYADFHKGYCIGFFERKLRESKRFGKGGPVIYYPKESFPIIDPFAEFSMEKVFVETHSKSEEWAYEREYRLSKLFYPAIPQDEERKVVVPNDFIAEVIIGARAPEEVRKEIFAISRLKNIKVYQAEIAPFRFEILRKEIQCPV